MVKYLLVFNGFIKASFYVDQKDEAIYFYKMYKQMSKNTILLEVSYAEYEQQILSKIMYEGVDF